MAERVLSLVDLAGFVSLTCALWLCWWTLLTRFASGMARAVGLAGLWLLVTGFLAARGFFQDFVSLPPRIPIFVILAVIFGVIFFRRNRAALMALPPTWVVGMQTFRGFVEILLASLATQELLPVEMSWHGRNFDVLVGLTALPLVFWMRYAPLARVRAVLIVWNVLGLFILTNVVVHGMLSVPYPFKVLTLSMDNIYISHFPVIWLPLFLVPSAYLLHAISLGQALDFFLNRPEKRSTAT